MRCYYNPSSQSLKELTDVCENRFRVVCRVNSSHEPEGVKVVDDWTGELLVGLEPLDDGVEVVVCPAARLPPLEKPLLHHLLGAVEEEQELDARLHHNALPAPQVVHISGKPVDQKFRAPGFLHRGFEQTHGDLRGNDLSLSNALVDQVSEP